MAINPIDKLATLKMALDILQARKLNLQQDRELLLRQAPGELDTAVAALLDPLDTAIDAAITRVETALDSTTITQADKVAFADAATERARPPKAPKPRKA